MNNSEYNLLHSHIQYKAKELLRLRGVHADEGQDLEHELYAQVIKAEDIFNPNMGTFATYASHIVDNATVSLVRITQRRLSPGYISLCTPKSNIMPPNETTLLQERRQKEKVYFRQLRETIARLPTFDRKLAIWTMQGISKREMARRLNMERNYFFRHRWRKFCENVRTALKDFH